MDRIFTFHAHKGQGNPVFMSPAYYIDSDYEKVAVRVYAREAPVRDASIDVYVDGASIFNDRGYTQVDPTTGVLSTLNSGTFATLEAGDNSELLVDDFTDDDVNEGTWLTCELVDAGGGTDFTVQVELRQISEDEEKSE